MKLPADVNERACHLELAAQIHALRREARHMSRAE